METEVAVNARAFDEPRLVHYYRLVRGAATNRWYVDLAHERRFTPEEFQAICLYALGATHGGALWEVAEYLENNDDFERLHPLVCHLYEVSPNDGRGLCGVYDDKGAVLTSPVTA